MSHTDFKKQHLSDIADTKYKGHMSYTNLVSGPVKVD